MGKAGDGRAVVLGTIRTIKPKTEIVAKIMTPTRTGLRLITSRNQISRGPDKAACNFFDSREPVADAPPSAVKGPSPLMLR